MSFGSLPRELVQEIIQHVPHPQTSLSLCSKSLHILTEPVLYASVSLIRRASYPKFVRTICSRPDLISYVRHFDSAADTFRRDLDLSFLKEKERLWIQQSLPSTFEKWVRREWVWSMFGHFPDDPKFPIVKWDAITAFLLCLFSNGLRSLQLKSYGFLEPRFHFIDMVIKQASKYRIELTPESLSLLPSLKSISIHGPGNYMYDHRLSIKSVLPYFQIAFAGEVRIRRLWDEGSTRFTSPSMVFGTVHLAILGSFLSAESMLQFLPCFPSLRSFKYQHRGIDWDLNDHLHTTIILAGLANSRSTLEQLVISDERKEPRRPWLRQHDNAIGSFRVFSRLREIKADAYMLLGNEIWTLNDNGVKYEFCRSFSPDQCINFVYSLPTTLEHLTIWRNTIAILDLLDYIFPAAGHMLLPHLKSLTLLFRAQTGSPSDSEMEGWRELASAVRVVLNWERTLEGLPVNNVIG